MKPLTLSDVEILKNKINEFIDYKVQNVFVWKKGYSLELVKPISGSKIFFIFDLTPNAPFLAIQEISKISFLKDKKPILLFLKAHLIGKRLSEIQTDSKLGRILFFKFGFEELIEFEFRLFPHGQNLIIKKYINSKLISKISEKPIKDIAPAIEKEVQNSAYLNSINYETLMESWLEKKEAPISKATAAVDYKYEFDKFILKKQKAKDKILEQIQNEQSELYFQAAQWIQAHSSLEVSDAYKDLIDNKKSFSWNLNSLFESYKTLKQKKVGMLERVQVLESEIEEAKNKFENADYSFLNIIETKKTSAQLKSKSKFIPLDPYELYIGRNAIENLKILRESQPWHLWLHLKDYPGAHGILRGPKNKDIDESLLKKAACLVAQKSQKSLHEIQDGDFFDLLCVEKRYVKPIPGDKLGRVRYTNEKVISVQMKKN